MGSDFEKPIAREGTMGSSAVSRLLRHRLPLLLLAGVAAGALGGCAANTQLVDMWKDPTAVRQPIHQILVVAMRRDDTSRRIWEDGFVAALNKRGVNATPSYSIFQQGVPDTADIEDAVRQRNFDGVLFAHRLGATTQTTYVPGYTTYEPVWVRSRWSFNYHTAYAEVHQPGYVETDRIVRYRMDLWNTADEWRLIWSGTTESFNPNSSRDVNREIAKLVVPELAAQGLVAR
jgi:hypothetical protein